MRYIAHSLVLGAMLLLSCHRSPTVEKHIPSTDPRVRADSVTYVDITLAAGITWRHASGAYGRKCFPEQHGAGCAFIDYDNDGWEDILLMQGRHWPGYRTLPESTMAMYHNNHDGTFSDVTAQVGLSIPMCGMGACVGDYDNDGWDDVYCTCYGDNHLMHNIHGVFEDVTEHARVKGSGRWSSSAMWIDYDNDGYLDLLSLSYLQWTLDNDVVCTIHGTIKMLCNPQIYQGDCSVLYHNNGNGTFTDASTQTGIAQCKGKALGAVMLDYDNDGWTDIFVSNDVSPNWLFHNEHGTFKEIGMQAGIAYDENGNARSGMGIDWADVDRDGRPTVMIGNFSGEMDWVYKYAWNNVFLDRAPLCGIGAASLAYLTFGLMMFDYDYDGWPDMFCVNGHVRPEERLINERTPDRMEPLLFRNLRGGMFEEVGLQFIKGPFEHQWYGRGACYGSVMNDGNIDLLAVNKDDRPSLLKCRRTNTNHYLRIKLQGVRSNRDGYGAIIFASVGGMNMVEMMKSGGSYESSNERVVTLGLGQARQVDQLIVKWNCGTIDTLRDVSGDRTILIREGMQSPGL